jgi:2-polyprenyl-3-methyl-5-hydroxy-6-metoxy-1,4-benzoquinol methylase
MPDLTQRCRQPELMDDPQLDQRLHRQALKGLSRVNWVTRTHRLLWHPIEAFCRESQRTSVSVLDLACGSGDLLVWLKNKARSKGIDLKISGCDLSPVALEAARQRAEQENMEAEFLQMDVLDGVFANDHDAVVCSLFLHHLQDGDVVSLLRRMANSARHLVVAQDLLRSRWGYLMCWMGTRLITRSPIVHVDGPLSVASAFTQAEIQQLAEQAGLADCQINQHWPARFVLTWKRSP